MASRLQSSFDSAQQEAVMSVILVLVRKWKAGYRVLRYGHGFGLMDSVRYGLWLALG